jgi:hypothetical protein
MKLHWNGWILTILGIGSSVTALEAALEFASPLGGSGDDRAYSVAVDRQGSIYIAGQTRSSDFPGANAGLSPARGGWDAFVTKFAPDGKSVLYTTILGGAGDERAYRIAVTSAGQAVLVGSTSSPDFPVKNAVQQAYCGGDRDGFVAVLDATGMALVFSTYLGGSGSDELTAVAVDSQGRICVGGTTQSGNLATAGAFQAENRGHFDGLVARLESNGTVDFCSYLGGSGIHDSILGLAVDAADNLFLTGYTSSEDFPKANAYQPAWLGGYDAFVTKLSANGRSIDFSTYLGGTADDVGRSIAVDSRGYVYVCGDTLSTSFPIANALYSGNVGRRDLFVTKLDPTGSSLVFSSYLGGTGEELGAMALDAEANICLAGLTSSRNWPTRNPFQPQGGGGSWDGFVATLASDGSGLLFSSFLGGTGNDQISGIAADAQGAVYLAGATTSTNIPSVNALQPAGSPKNQDAFVAKVNRAPSTNLFRPVVAVAKAKPVSPAAPKTAPKPAAKAPAKPRVAPVPPPSAPDPLGAIAAALPLFGKNLVVNGTAESANPSAPPGATNAFPGWTTDGHVTAGQYTAFTSLAAPTNGGNRFFMGLTNVPASRATQTIDLTRGTPFIDSGDVRFNAEAWLGAWQEQTDTAAVLISFRDDAGKVLAETRLGPVTGKERSFFNRLVRRTATGQVPAATRKVSLELELKPDDQAGAPARADNLSLVLLRPPATLLQVTRSDNQVKLSWPTALQGVILESSAFLPPAAQWEPVTEPPQVVGEQNTLVLGIENTGRYFRLRRVQ